MVELTADEFAAANARGQDYFNHHPVARSARYDHGNDRIVIELTNGCAFAFPPRLVQGLQDASPDQLAQVSIGSGIGLHWDELDVDITVSGLMNGVLGTTRWMASQAGRVTSPAKAAAARSNGKLGGRPRKLRAS